MFSRINEHKWDVRKKENKVVLRHCVENKHKINWQKTSILDIEANYYKRKISEMLHIHMQKEPMNKKEDTRFLHDSYRKFLNKLTHIDK